MKGKLKPLDRNEMRQVKGGSNGPPTCAAVEDSCTILPCCDPYVCKNVPGRGYRCQVWTPS